VSELFSYREMLPLSAAEDVMLRRFQGAWLAHWASGEDDAAAAAAAPAAAPVAAPAAHTDISCLRLSEETDLPKELAPPWAQDRDFEAGEERLPTEHKSEQARALQRRYTST